MTRGEPFTIRVVGTTLPGKTFGELTGVRVALQVGADHVGWVAGDAQRAEWTIDARVDERGVAYGPAIHGKPAERFLYLVWAAGNVRFRRAKLQLDAVPKALLKPGKVLVATLALTDAKGAPVCASVRPPLIKWTAG